MAQVQQIKRRIRSVKNTKQITKAMELVAASKMRKAQEATLRSRPYRNSAREILARLNQLTDASAFPYFDKRTVQNRLYILFTSDRGLAGAYNSNLLKLFTKRLQADKTDNVSSHVIVIGRKGARFVSRLEDINLVGVYENWPDRPTANDIRPLLETSLQQFNGKIVDEVVMIYTDYKSSINQVATTQVLLPASIAGEDEMSQGEDINNSEFEPSLAKVVDVVVPKLIESQLYQDVLEAIASEHSMRMLAMKNATDNAGELIDDLTLVFNSARQAAITQELAEIIGGAAAIS